MARTRSRRNSKKGTKADSSKTHAAKTHHTQAKKKDTSPHPAKTAAHESRMHKPQKDVVYVDVEDEITSVIDKVATSKEKIVAIVLPKRSAVFQNLVNVKLLHRRAKKSHKQVVIITKDPAVLAHAAIAGIHVAPTLQSKPSLAQMPTAAVDKAGSDKKSTESVAPETTQEGIEISTEGAAKNASDTKDVSPKIQTDTPKKHLKIPDFGSFRLRLILGSVGIIGLVALWYVAFFVLPRATITVLANTKTIPIEQSVDLVLSKTAEVDVASSKVPAVREQLEKIDSVTVPATGEKNVGERATGVLTLENCVNNGEDYIVPAGTGFSANDRTYVTAEQVVLPAALYLGGSCVNKEFGRTRDVTVRAIEPGPEYNTVAQSFQSSISGINAEGTEMIGGTRNIVKVVSQEDIDKAENQIKGESRDDALSELKESLKDQSLIVLDDTFTPGKNEVVSSVEPDTEADEVKVTSTVSYSMIGVKEDDLVKIIDQAIVQKLDGTQLNIRDNGIENLSIDKSEKTSSGFKVLLRTIAEAGPDIDVEQQKNDLAGKKRGEIQQQLQQIEGVVEVNVEYSPMWVTTTPKDPNKLEIVVNETE